MKKHRWSSLFVILFVTGFGVAAPTDPQFEKILDPYFDIQASLAADSTEGIESAAQSIQQLAAQVQTENSQIRQLVSDLELAAGKIQGKELEAARLVFFEMSKPLLVYLHQFYSGEREYFRYYCSMAKKGWIQPEKSIRNPYHGTSMLTCGELIE